jgi:hypothetical protein
MEAAAVAGEIVAHDNPMMDDEVEVEAATDAAVMTLGLQLQSVALAEYFPHKGGSRVISNSRGIRTELSLFLFF